MPYNQIDQLLHRKLVAVARITDPIGYPIESPYNPPEIYPEYPFSDGEVDRQNQVYSAVREALYLMGLDRNNFGSPNWNPIGDLVRPGATVIVKVNFVLHSHPDGDQAVITHMLTHPSVIRPIVDYVYRAVGSTGRVLIVDTPLDKANVAHILKLLKIDQLLDFYKARQVPVTFMDLREEHITVENEIVHREKLMGDPQGTVIFRLDKESAFAELDSGDPIYHTLADWSYDHYDPTCNTRGLTNLHHNKEKHEYSVGRTFLSADAIISVPKLKTHKKAGVTLNLKNMIGICFGKTYMPHHRPGMPPQGDASPYLPPKTLIGARSRRIRAKQAIAKLPGGQYIIGAVRWMLRDLLKIPAREWNYIEHGDWYGNDTIWRTIVDLNKIMLYGNKDGFLQSEPQRAYLSVIDGIIGQQGEGPMNGFGFPAGVIIGGFAPLTTDVVAAQVMGFDPTCIPQLCYDDQRYFLGYESKERIDLELGHLDSLPVFKCVPPKGWKGHIEE